MESNNHTDESICHYSSNEEDVDVDLRPASDDEEEDEQSKINSLGGRWYECVFCKRGFTTAQALGGHMNIHRKDRAKNNHTSSILSSSAMSGCYYDDHHRDTYTGPRDYQPILHGGYAPPPPPPPLLLSPILGGTELGHPVYFSDQYTHNNNYGKGLYPCVGDDWSMKLSLQLGSASTGMVHDYHMEKKGERSRVHKELDLELRLGPDP